VFAVDELDVLKQVPLFSHMDVDELSSVRTLMVAHGYAPGQVILREGELGDRFHVVVGGHVQFLLRGPAGNGARQLQRARMGEEAGEPENQEPKNPEWQDDTMTK
jgi:hypothetical protein